MTWLEEQIAWIGVVDTESSGDIITIRLATPAGIIDLMGLVELDGRVMRASGVHLQNESGDRPGVANIYAMARFVLERLDLDEAIVEGALRTTGANPGHRPGQFRFRRRRGASATGRAQDHPHD